MQRSVRLLAIIGLSGKALSTKYGLCIFVVVGRCILLPQRIGAGVVQNEGVCVAAIGRGLVFPSVYIVLQLGDVCVRLIVKNT